MDLAPPNMPYAFLHAHYLNVELHLTFVTFHLLQYCVEHRMPIMRTSWITESHDTWLSGDDIDFKTALNKHRLPVFTSIRLCITGIDPIEKRTQVHKLLLRGGGIFIKDLDRNTTTHLLCGEEGENETDERGYTLKMQYAEKVNIKGAGRIHMVWEEWFWDCLEFGGE